MSDAQIVLKYLFRCFVVCAVLSVVMAGINAIYPSALGDFLAKRFAEMMPICLTAMGAFLAGHHYGQKQERKSRKSTKSARLR